MTRIAALIALLALGVTSAKADDVKDYGEYLSGECTTCHKLDGSGENIPSIVGWDVENFIEILKSYTNGERTNKAMASVAKSLDDQQMRALAVYFASLEPK